MEIYNVLYNGFEIQLKIQSLIVKQNVRAKTCMLKKLLI